MPELDDAEDEFDYADGEASDEAIETATVGLLAFDAAAGLVFPDELQDDGVELQPREAEIAPASQILSVPDGAPDVDWALSCEADELPADAYVLPGELDEAPPGAIDEVLDSMTYDELIEAREQLVVSKETAEYASVIDDVNPNFDPNVDNAYARNCGGCAFSTWERLSGIDSQAQADWRNIGTIGGMERACNMHFEECAPEQIEQFARSQGPGWHGMCAMQWPPDGETGHWVNLATSETGHVYVLDGQCGEVSLLRDYVEQNPAIRYHVNVR